MICRTLTPIVTEWRRDRWLLIAPSRFWWRLTGSRADFINVWCKPGSFLTSTSFILLSVRSKPLSQTGGGGVEFQAGPANQLRGRQRVGTKPPTVPPQLAFKDGINWLYKRYQRKVLLRVPVSIASFGERPENRKVLSVCRAGLQALARANEVVLITREASPSP